MSNSEIENRLNRIEILDSILNRLAQNFSERLQYQVTREDIFDALYLELQHIECLEHPLDFWDLDINYEQAFQTIRNFDFEVLKNKIETPALIIPKDLLMNFKIRIKSNNIIWVIHKYDKDPFPSNPHAHNLNSGIKLDLSNGDCYKKRTLVHRINRKDLIELREKAEEYFELPEMCL